MSSKYDEKERLHNMLVFGLKRLIDKLPPEKVELWCKQGVLALEESLLTILLERGTSTSQEIEEWVQFYEEVFNLDVTEARGLEVPSRTGESSEDGLILVSRDLSLSEGLIRRFKNPPKISLSSHRKFSGINGFKFNIRNPRELGTYLIRAPSDYELECQSEGRKTLKLNLTLLEALLLLLKREWSGLKGSTVILCRGSMHHLLGSHPLLGSYPLNLASSKTERPRLR